MTANENHRHFQSPRGLLRRMVSRNPGESHRAATPLELLYDLCFVVAVAQAALSLHHSIAEGHGFQCIPAYAMVFFAIWWAWMGFAWFASAFDTDDALYRVMVFIQMIGVTVLAAGVPRGFNDLNFGLMTAGFAIMRIGLVSQWLRAAYSSPAHRRTALRYANGIIMCQLGWIGLLFLPGNVWMYGWLVLVPLELAVPAWAERAQPTTWHPHHIAERYGLFTIIVIGESVLAATIAIQKAIDEGGHARELVWVIIGAPLIIFSMWWLYFARPHHERLVSIRAAFLWGYGHYFIFAAAAAVGAGLAVAVEQATHHTEISAFRAGESLAIPASVYLAALWCAQFRCQPDRARLTIAVAATIILLLLAPLVAPTPLAMGLILAGLTTFVVCSSTND